MLDLCFPPFFEAFICLGNVTFVYLKQRGAFESFAAVLAFVRLLSRVGPAKEKSPLKTHK